MILGHFYLYMRSLFFCIRSLLTLCAYLSDVLDLQEDLFQGAEEDQRQVCMYVCMYVHTYVYTCYVLINPPMPIYYVLAAVFASCFYVLKSLLHE